MIVDKIDFANWTRNPDKHRADVYRIAAQYADICSRHRADGVDPDTLTVWIWKQLDAILDARQQAQRQQAAGADFVGVDPEGDTYNSAGRIKLLNVLFRAVCRELAAQGITLPMRTITNRKQRYGVKLSCMDALGRPDIPEGERLTQTQAATLWQGLTRYGLVSGPETAFNYYFGPLPNPVSQSAPEGLIWHGKPRNFAYFVYALSNVLRENDKDNPEGNRKTTRGAEICRVFGYDYRKKNIYQYVKDFKDGAKPTKGKAATPYNQIDAVFNRLKNQTPK